MRDISSLVVPEWKKAPNWNWENGVTRFFGRYLSRQDLVRVTGGLPQGQGRLFRVCLQGRGEMSHAPVQE